MPVSKKNVVACVNELIDLNTIAENAIGFFLRKA
jgi:hypothetical protein